MDYFAIGGKPFLSRFPPHIPGIFNPQEQSHQEPSPGDCSATNPADHLVDGHALKALQAFQKAQAQFQQAQALAADQANYRSSRGAASSAARPAAPYAASDSEDEDVDDGHVKAPRALHQGYDHKEVRDWPAQRFEVIRKLQDATRNRGQVVLMKDKDDNRLVAVKIMPNRWVGTSHSDFVIDHPSETELPWQDLGCVRFLNDVGFPYACDLLGVYRDAEHTYVVTTFATEGDLFSWCEGGVAPGHEREIVVQPIARQLMEGIQQLHDFGIVHRDLSLENVLMSKTDGDTMTIKIIDFSMASTARSFRNCIRGKASYQAPELHTDQEYDAYLTDAFSLGVTLYAVLLKDYPWLSTRPGGCKCFEYVKKHGFRAYLAKRKLRNSTQRVVEFMSEPLVCLLEGLLTFEPSERLTLGERKWGSSRPSIWDLSWLHEGPGKV